MLLQYIQEDLKQAMRDKDENKVSTLRLLLSELKYAQLKNSTELSDEDILTVIQREIKKRNESIVSYKTANRLDLSQKEEDEVEVLKHYLPPQLSDEELTQLVLVTINELGATAPADMGRVIGAVMSKVSGRADGSRVSNLVREKLSGR